MRLKNRVEQLEAVAAAPARFFIMPVFVPAKDGKFHGAENGSQRVRCGELTWLRKEGESEEAFIARARAEVPKDNDPEPQGMAAVYRRRFIADYGDFDL